MRMIFEHFPILEVLTRVIYKRMLALGILKKRIIIKDVKKYEYLESSIRLNDLLSQFNICKGDILIVHSSMGALKKLGIEPKDIINALLEKVGDNGTLVMPTYPNYPKTSVRLTYDERYDKEFLYDVNNTLGWTGVITEQFRKMDGVKRSCYPNNTLAAYGKYAKTMFEKEMEDDVAFGACSAWRFCANHNAKVLFLGVHAHHSISEIHIPEDMLDDTWPIKGWYAKKTYNITNGSINIKKECRVRKDFWTKYLTEYRCSYELRKNGLLEEKVLDGIPISFVSDVLKLEKMVTDRALNGDLLIFRIPKKYWRL